MAPRKRSKKNPYSSRGLDKFSSVLSELEARKKKIMSSASSNGVSLVRFMHSNSRDWTPVIVRHREEEEDKNKTMDKERLLPPAAKTEREKKEMKWWRWRPSYYMLAVMLLILVCFVISGRTSNKKAALNVVVGGGGGGGQRWPEVVAGGGGRQAEVAEKGWQWPLSGSSASLGGQVKVWRKLEAGQKSGVSRRLDGSPEFVGGQVEVWCHLEARRKSGVRRWPGGSPTSLGDRAEVRSHLEAGRKSGFGRRPGESPTVVEEESGVRGLSSFSSFSSLLGSPLMRNEGSIYNFLRVRLNEKNLTRLRLFNSSIFKAYDTSEEIKVLRHMIPPRNIKKVQQLNYRISSFLTY
ncbi:hypothetical protein M5K25_025636 [Dendrobium thyrsiflorum]|uniref:Uncharacterized protein n=1 Tax=Dendrobium thyrsiflorum TaxID=117978 RepID=A0ABD0UA75_DENTH